MQLCELRMCAPMLSDWRPNRFAFHTPASETLLSPGRTGSRTRLIITFAPRFWMNHTPVLLFLTFCLFSLWLYLTLSKRLNDMLEGQLIIL